VNVPLRAQQGVETSPSGRKPSITANLTGRPTQVCLTLAFSFGTGLWLQCLHDLEGGVEPGAPPLVLHWLRDSALSVPLVMVGVVLGTQLARTLLERYGRAASERQRAALVAAVVAMYAGVTLAVGNPIHGLLFSAHEAAGHDLPLTMHLVRDGLLALSANAAIGWVVMSAQWRLHVSARTG
jgi:hypothetical protein